MDMDKIKVVHGFYRILFSFKFTTYYVGAASRLKSLKNGPP